MREIERQVEKILLNRNKMRQELDLLSFELKCGSHALMSEAIENMTFTGSNAEKVSCSKIADKTANIAVKHVDAQYTPEYMGLRELAGSISLELNRIEYYLTLLPEMQAKILALYYFEGKPWGAISELTGVSERTLLRNRKSALARLSDFYSLLNKASPDKSDFMVIIRFVGYIHEERFKSCVGRLSECTGRQRAFFYILAGCNELWNIGIEVFFDFDAGFKTPPPRDGLLLSDSAAVLLELANHLLVTRPDSQHFHAFKYLFRGLDRFQLELAIEAIKTALLWSE